MGNNNNINLLFFQLGQMTLEKIEQRRLDPLVLVHHNFRLGPLGVLLHYSSRSDTDLLPVDSSVERRIRLLKKTEYQLD